MSGGGGKEVNYSSLMNIQIKANKSVFLSGVSVFGSPNRNRQRVEKTTGAAKKNNPKKDWIYMKRDEWSRHRLTKISQVWKDERIDTTDIIEKGNGGPKDDFSLIGDDKNRLHLPYASISFYVNLDLKFKKMIRKWNVIIINSLYKTNMIILFNPFIAFYVDN